MLTKFTRTALVLLKIKLAAKHSHLWIAVLLQFRVRARKSRTAQIRDQS